MVFDPTDMTVTAVTTMSGSPLARAGHGFKSFGDAIYVHGGVGSGESCSALFSCNGFEFNRLLAFL